MATQLTENKYHYVQNLFVFHLSSRFLHIVLYQSSPICVWRYMQRRCRSQVCFRDNIINVHKHFNYKASAVMLAISNLICELSGIRYRNRNNQLRVSCHIAII